jgi:hypothetical protein
MRVDDINVFESLGNFIADQSTRAVERDKQKLEAIRAAQEQLTPTPAQSAYLSSMLVPGSSLPDVSGNLPSFPSADVELIDAFSGDPLPSLPSNLQEGRYLDAFLQSLGLAGDALYAVPGAGPVLGSTIGTGLKGIGALGAVAKAGMASKSGIAALTTSKVQRAQELINQGKATAGKPEMTKKMVEPTKIPEGKIVEVRKNLNSRFDDPELSEFKAQTIHNPKKLKSGKLSEAESEIGKGSAISYDPAVTLKSNGTPIQLKVNQKARDEIASKTKPKNPMAAVRGMYDDLDIFDPDITLGFNPMRQNVFIDAQGYGVKAIKNGKATVVDNDVLVKLDNPENFKIVEDATGNQVKLFDDIEYYNVGNLPKTNNPSDVKVVKKNFEGIGAL